MDRARTHFELDPSKSTPGGAISEKTGPLSDKAVIHPVKGHVRNDCAGNLHPE